MTVTRTGPAPGVSGARSVPVADPGGEYRLPKLILLPATAMPPPRLPPEADARGDYVAVDSPHEAPGPDREVGEPRSLGGHAPGSGAGHLRGALGGRQRAHDRLDLSGRRAGARRLGWLG